MASTPRPSQGVVSTTKSDWAILREKYGLNKKKKKKKAPPSLATTVAEAVAEIEKKPRQKIEKEGFLISFRLSLAYRALERQELVASKPSLTPQKIRKRRQRSKHRDKPVHKDGTTEVEKARQKLKSNTQPTRRGCRGGTLLRRPFHTIVSPRPTPSAKPPCVNGANLVHVMLKNCEMKSNTHLALINARSIRNKATIRNEHIVEHKWDVFVITETWLSKNGDEATIAEVTPPGYTFQHVARASGRGGGVAIVHRNTYKTKLQPKLTVTTMDLLCLQIINPHCVKYNVCVVYHPCGLSTTPLCPTSHPD
ncbi:hypothetical protein LSAT2_007642 [Lamellibrachia satsuma]|nr:hypothetical protein LSAT2_007642 [Lamellibrachia satsuma]